VITSEGQSLLPCLPLRAEPRSSSEMTSQLLYGQTYTAKEHVPGWVKIVVDSDHYEGWISENQFAPILFAPEYVQNMEVFILLDGTVIPMGSKLPTGQLQDDLNLNATHLARKFLGSPYLWGGKTFMGIDCSGLIQVVYGCIGFNLPRDSSMQVLEGRHVEYKDHKAGDLAFFHNEKDAVTHVGIISDRELIIHACGSVREDQLTSEGIINKESGKLTHTLNCVRRLR